MLVKYITYLTPGSFFPGEHTSKLSENAPEPKNCFGFYTFEVEEVTIAGELLTGEAKNKSGYTYYGRKMHLTEIEALVKDPDILLSNLRQYGEYGVLCVTGNFRPLEPRDTVIERPLMAGVTERVFK